MDIMRFAKPLFTIAVILLLVEVVINGVGYFQDQGETIKEFPPEPSIQVDSAKALDDVWKAKVAEQNRKEDEGRQNLIYMADIKREMHSMRAQYNIFLKLNHKIEAERREAARQERIRIQKEKAAERKRLREERIAEQKRLKAERALERQRLKEERAAERKQHALDSARKHIQRKGMGKSSSSTE
jgi:hypothetical protein